MNRVAQMRTATQFSVFYCWSIQTQSSTVTNLFILFSLERYGIKNIKIRDKEKMQGGTVMIARSLQCCQTFKNFRKSVLICFVGLFFHACFLMDPCLVPAACDCRCFS